MHPSFSIWSSSNIFVQKCHMIYVYKCNIVNITIHRKFHKENVRWKIRTLFLQKKAVLHKACTSKHITSEANIQQEGVCNPPGAFFSHFPTLCNREQRRKKKTHNNTQLLCQLSHFSSVTHLYSQRAHGFIFFISAWLPLFSSPTFIQPSEKSS